MSDAPLRARLSAANMKLVADTGFLGTDDPMLEVAIKGPITENQRNYNVGTCTWCIHSTQLRTAFM